MNGRNSRFSFETKRGWSLAMLGEFVRKIIKDKICICDTILTEEMEKN